MPQPCVVLLGNIPADNVRLYSLAASFGWSLEKAASFASLKELAGSRAVVAVLFEASMWKLSWEEALRLVIDAAPDALPVLCHGFADILHLPDLADAGAFHALRLPLHADEVRQSLGFVWAARGWSKGRAPGMTRRLATVA